ncbi:hypothetical protein [uncultured Prevotella sp.]|uniref:hypothetical protein n=1 Tax=uncultured Prevotella sp. TaxID=159272 RepID=UPI0025E088F8|nr:hypothetical protein [uncultured Prevotella sp.]
MRELSELEKQNEEFLVNKRISFTTVMMTHNILSHSIFDANKQIVKYLKEQGLHDYDIQKNGKDERVMIKTHILTFTEDVLSKSSLYKAGTRGDKRMWFGAAVLPYTDDNDIFAIIAHEGELYIINESKFDFDLCYMTNVDNPIKVFLKGIKT